MKLLLTPGFSPGNEELLQEGLSPMKMKTGILLFISKV
jgi:hypothetical protein